MLDLILVAGAVGLSNFAAAIGIGLSGVDGRLRARLALVFGVFEAGMPIAGVALGRQLAHAIGAASAHAGGALLAVVGIYTVWQARRSRPRAAAGQPRGTGSGTPSPRLGPLLLTGAALSIDNLIVGFALGTHTVPLAVAAIMIGGVSVALSLIGLEVGRLLGGSVEKWSGEIGGGVLLLVGAAIGFGLF